MDNQQRPTIYFYLADELWPAKDNAIPSDWPGYLYAHGAWVVRTYNELVSRGLSCSLVRYPPNDGIVFTYYNCAPARLAFWKSWMWPTKGRFVVCIRGDRGRKAFAQAHMSQNPMQSRIENSSIVGRLLSRGPTFYVPHWTLDNIIPRDSERKDIKNIVFFGTKTQLPVELLGDEWDDFVRSMDMRWIINGDISKCRDYSAADIVIAIRDFSGNPHHRKPAWKIVNGWRARALVIASPESSSRGIRVSEDDYIEVGSYDDLKRAIRDIKQGAVSYERHVMAGSHAGEGYTADAIAKRWVEIIINEIIPEYHKYIRINRVGRAFYAAKRTVDAILNSIIATFTVARFTARRILHKDI